MIIFEIGDRVVHRGIAVSCKLAQISIGAAHRRVVKGLGLAISWSGYRHRTSLMLSALRPAS
jgi:hypothetical protein